MHHVVLERWSRGRSFLHERDARGKILVLLAFLVALATTHRITPGAAAGYFGYLALGILAARLPWSAVLARAALVLPFAAAFAVGSIIAGQPARAADLLLKSYLSALAALLLVGVTPLPRLVAGAESLGVPRFLAVVAQFLYRYLFVISEQAQHMRLAATCRGAGSRGGAPRFRAAAGALAVLFGRSYARAEGIHRAMLSRGFDGGFPLLSRPRFGRSDLVFCLAGAAAPLAWRFAMGGA